MKRKALKFLGSACLAGVVLLGPGEAAAVDSAAGTATGSFLKVGGSARSLAMGGAGTVLLAESGALWVNPGQLAGLPAPEFSYTRGQWVQDIEVNQVSFAGPLPVGTIGAAVDMLDMGAIDSYDASGAAAGSIQPKDTAVVCGYAAELGKAGLGGSVTYIRSELAEDAQVSGFAVDVGGRFEVLPNLTFAAAVQHAGPGMKFGKKASDLPMVVRGGASAGLLGERVRLVADVMKPSDGVPEFLGGAELSQIFGDVTLSLRGGWRSVAPQGSNAGFSAGGGLRWHPKKPLGSDEMIDSEFGAADSLRLSGLRVDYAWTPMGELGVANWLSFSIAF